MVWILKGAYEKHKPREHIPYVYISIKLINMRQVEEAIFKMYIGFTACVAFLYLSQANLF